MKYFVYASPTPRGAQPLETLNYEPNEFMIGQLATKYGNIVVHPELIQVGPAEPHSVHLEREVQKQMPPGIKTDWKK